MAQFARPDSDILISNWGASGPTPFYQYIDEVTASDTDYISNNITATAKFGASNVTDPSSSTGHIIRFRAKEAGTATCTIKLYQGATLIAASATEALTSSYADYSYTLSAAEANAITDYNALEFHVVPTLGFLSEMRFSWVELEVPSATSTHPSPTSMEIDRVATPNNTCSEDPLFSVIAETNAAETINKMQIQVSADNTFATTHWDSGFVTIANVTDGNRTDEYSFAGTVLSSHPTDDKYYVRIRLQDSAATNSLWSATGEFKVTKRDWAWADANMRVKLLWDASHTMEIPAGYVQDFTFKTGNRQVVATNGYFNEAIQASGGFQVAYHNARTHIVYLGEYDAIDSIATIWINSFDHITEMWGTPYRISGAGQPSTAWFDTHYFPTLAIDADGHIHVMYGAHDNQFEYTRTRVANQSGALPGDTQTKTWIKPSALPTETAGSDTPSGMSGTYPILFWEPTALRLFHFFRYTANSGEYAFMYSDDSGKTWSTIHKIIDDTVSPYRIYVYGLRYDEVAQRLHISWTFNQVGDVERGIWYAYSDYDNTDGSSLTTAGFNIFKWADGTHAGYTSNVTAHVEIDYTTSKAIELSTDQESKIFSETLVLDANSKPVVFWEQKPEDGIPTEETDLVCATYSAAIGSAGSWNKHYISEQVDMKLRVRRSSIGVMTDKDGVIKAYMPVNAKTYTHFLPTSDVDDVGATPDTGVINYTQVDDGITAMEGSSYVEIAAGTTNKFSCASSKTIDTSYSVLKVEVHAVIQSITSAGNYQLYIDDGTTENKKASVAAITDDFTYVKEVWATNPFTSAAWANGEIDALEFGVYNANASVKLRVARLFMRVLYTIADDDELFATEIWELKSTDNGVTWTVNKEISRNSGIGTPIMNHKHQLTNEQIEICWTSGNDIFYLRDEPYGLALPSGIDVRLYYDGAEIDRIMDYANLDETRFKFQVQAAIPALHRAGAADYELYFAAPNTSTGAKSDPQNIYEFFENNETYDDGDNLSGVGGWTVSSGTMTCVKSPGPDLTDNHANKIYAGEGAAKFAGAGTAEHSITTNFTDVFVEFAMWQEFGGGSDKPYLQIKDGAGKTAGCGHNNVSNLANYEVDGVFTDNSITIPSDQQLMQAFAFALNSDGLSCWLNGKLFARNITTVVMDADKILIQSIAKSYWDFIRVSKRIGKQSVTTVDPPTPKSSFVFSATDDMTAEIADGLFESNGAYKNISSIEVRIGLAASTGTSDASVKVRVIKAANWSSTATVVATATLTWTAVGTTTVYKTNTFTFADLGGEADEFSVKVDFYSTTDGNTLSMTKDWDWIKLTVTEVEPTIDVQPREVMGWYMDAVLQGSGTDTWIMDANINGVFFHVPQISPVGYKGEFAIQSDSPAGFGSGLVSSYDPPIAFTGYLSSGTITPAGFGSGLVSSYDPPIAFTGYLSSGTITPAEILAAISYDIVSPIGWPGVMTSRQMFHVEHLLEAVARVVSPVESGLIMQALNTLSPVEIASGLAVDTDSPIEYRGSMAAPMTFPIDASLTMEALRATIPNEYGQMLESIITSSISHSSGTVVRRKSPVEYQGSVAISTPAKFPVGYQGAMAQSTTMRISFETGTGYRANMVVGHQAGVAGGIISPIGYRGALKAGITTPVEDLLSILGVRAGLPSGFGFGVGAGFAFPVAYRTGTRSTVVSPVEFLGAISLSIPAEFPIDYLAGLTAVQSIFPQSYGLGAAISGNSPVGFKSGQAIQTISPIDWTGGAVMSIPGKMPIDIRSALAYSGSMPIEELRQMALSGSFSIENLVSVSGISTMPLEQLRGIAMSAKAMSEWAGSVGAKVSMFVDYKGSTSSKILAKVEFGQYVAITTEFPLEALISATMRAGLPAEFSGIAITALLIANCELLVTQFNSPDLLLPTASGAEVLPPKISSKDLFVTGVDAAELLTPDADDHEIAGF